MRTIVVAEFNRILKIAMNDGSPLRVGQCLYAELLEQYPDIAEEITGTDIDPFLDDDNIYELMITICKDFEPL